ncbi:MAG: 2-amino-4-hydroxy-6-hydroxymethyldihydropteridine diphosphokinase [Armatimonadota bacterium]|nr:2-amino-4-hydroxy-6-hydroxymethyldihydropteridine diphosphokinase [Armatimonadota bacterium]MDR7451615.1 2-amino-4-hydroxy-6-hydroxymethyldihydropteridine diphosphokinase [Armatimonadota bacterium]MDR7467665.1 2-amino-4-hydroxy-6-hydroxymethyldihydropteridine diphosphokinase [Armatimonadota bacterium]MDR7492584.1 2-amino-4-hydroxy-6-hydroxymethyldihydropteridine diphosphokinase [Armatimonadota bacterium]MDR7499948.1 2-amino-4-hydroxy-6-hydroxymethyldihydropteridine diphosphokinase [Armatimon
MSGRAFLSLGANLGDRREAIAKALRTLEAGGVTVLRRSAFYDTAPVGHTRQPRFLNLVVEVDTALSPEELLELCQRIERSLGRVRTERWGPRPIDIDLLLYEGVTRATPSLILPHPRMTERAFVLRPLLEIAPEATLPDGRPLRDFLDAVADQDAIRIP